MSQNLNKKKLARIFREVVAQDIDMEDFLTDLFTPAEIDDLAMRIKLLSKLLHKETHRDIAQELGISVAKVSRGSNVLKAGTGALRKFLQKKA